ncbi:hypothetical protein Hdeb2414_s0015g00447991 [Helianthus debilis subsp. tardiflorus]
MFISNKVSQIPFPLYKWGKRFRGRKIWYIGISHTSCKYTILCFICISIS